MPLIPLFVQNELDASDTDLDNLLSAFNWCNPFDHILPFADGTIGETDRAHLWGVYSGIVAVVPIEVLGIRPALIAVAGLKPGPLAGIRPAVINVKGVRDVS